MTTATGVARPGISGVSPAELAAWLAARAEPAYRLRQVLDAVWRGDAAVAADVRTLPGTLRDALDAAFRWDTLAANDRVVTDGGTTEKVLHRLDDGSAIESVLMHYPAAPDRRERHTL